jgi:hypothetical protein
VHDSPASIAEVSQEERRQHARNRPSKDLGLFVRFKPGLNAAVVNLSAGGILVETRQRLHPGTLVELRFFDQHRATTIRGEVLRSTVSKLMAASIWYRGAIRFEHPLVWPPTSAVLKFPAR